MDPRVFLICVGASDSTKAEVKAIEKLSTRNRGVGEVKLRQKQKKGA